MIGIYKILSPTGKIYIGQSIDINKRWLKYKRLTCKKQPKVFRSLKKYGPENHIFEVIEECKENQLNKQEIYYKKVELGKVNWDWSKVLFCELHDKSGGPRSEDTKQKIRKSNIGRPKPKGFMNKNHKLKISLSKMNKPKSKEFGLNHSLKMKGKKLSNNHKLKIGKGNSKFVIQYDLQMKPIKEWPSATKVELFYSKNKKNDNVAACCRGKQKTTYGYIFKYKEIC